MTKIETCFWYADINFRWVAECGHVEGNLTEPRERTEDGTHEICPFCKKVISHKKKNTESCGEVEVNHDQERILTYPANK